MRNKKGKLIVLEGIDGSGKSTQHELLVKHLRSKGKIVKTIKFPRHGKRFFGVMVDEYLNGKFGQASKVDGRLASILFALDRFEVADKIRTWLSQGYYVVPDRYTTSNLGHQLGKIINKPDEIKNDFIKWDQEMEYKVLNIPKPDKILYLYVDLETIKRLLKQRGRGDQHESDIKYLKNSQLAYDYVCAHSKSWTKVSCMNKTNDDIDAISNIHQKIIAKIDL